MYQKFSRKNRKFIGLLLTIVGTLCIVAAKYHKTNLTAVPAETTTYKAVIFDLGEVLFSTPAKAKHAIIIPTILKNPSLLYYLIGFAVKDEFFKVLHTVPARTSMPMYHQAICLPQIMVDWQTGISSCDEIQQSVTEMINATPHPQAIKKLFHSIANLMFNPEILASWQSPNVGMLHLAQKLKTAGYKIYALSNWDPESFAILEKTHPKIFNIFDGMLISGHEKIGKPSPEFYQRLLTKYNLQSSDCIFIDDESYNIQAAQQIGIHSILCDQPTSVIQELIKIGVVLLPS